jgi:hypothetical protein
VPIVVGCIDYQFYGSGKHHQTGFAYQVIGAAAPDINGPTKAGFSTIRLIQYDPLTGQDYSFAN